jgi:outer membrane protein assembly factor BamE (lipoprotein component of BamABCDE complex)
MKYSLFLLALVLSSCVSVDPDTGKTIPRGDQKYEFRTVERNATYLRLGMRRGEVLSLLGSPAETNGDGSIWYYLPERPAVLAPSRGLKLEFRGNSLAKFGYSPIVLGHHE